jgi:hypothetical protein
MSLLCMHVLIHSQVYGNSSRPREYQVTDKEGCKAGNMGGALQATLQASRGLHRGDWQDPIILVFHCKHCQHSCVTQLLLRCANLDACHGILQVWLVTVKAAVRPGLRISNTPLQSPSLYGTAQLLPDTTTVLQNSFAVLTCAGQRP